MDIGPALAEARTKAGMTIQDVSDRTRIRGKIISDIERDDYSACGGDFYTRGHIRAIAKVVGADPVPLIEQYDGNLAAGTTPPATPEAEALTKPQANRPRTRDPAPATPSPEPGRAPRQGGAAGAKSRANGKPEPGGGEEPAAGGMPEAGPRPALWQRSEPQEVNGQPLLGIATDRLRQSAENVRRAGADAYRQSVPRVREAGADAYRRTIPPARRSGEQAVRRAVPWARRATADVYDRMGRLRTTDRRWSVMIGAAVIVLAGLIILIYALASGSLLASGHVTSGGRHPAVSRPAPRRPRASTARRSHAPSVRVASPPARPLRPVSVAAFGPGGTGQGDNPQQASLALSGQDGGWHTNWYTTANFGNLQSGTGLLLDMGQAVTVTQARIDLGSAAGGALVLRAGNQPVLADLVPVTRSADTGGTITLAPGHPVAARYLLIWFTRLPPDNAGTYQATIYHVNLTGFG